MRRRRRIESINQQHELVAEKSSKNIGIYLQRNETNELFCASDRIRGEWIAKNSDEMELFIKDKIYETVIFHLVSYSIHRIEAQIKLLNICDEVWNYNPDDFCQVIDPIDAIIVPTQTLKQKLSKITDKKVYVIPDGHDFEHYNSRSINTHTEKAKEAVWFGYAENSECLTPHINYLKSCGIKLKVIAQHQNAHSLKHADVFVKWDINTYISEISKSDFAILPFHKEYKSNNKEITALMCGIPVAKNHQDISRFIHASERKKEMQIKTPELEKYNAKYRAEEYSAIINDLKKKLIPAYTAIFGGYDKSRNDIKVFTDSASDKFNMPVMNAKIYKVLSHKYFSEPIIIYMDGNIFLKAPRQKLVDEFLQDADIALFKHPVRNCIFHEHAPARARIPVQHQPLMDEQVMNYKKEGMPEKFGLGECNMIIRRNNDVVHEFNERWWAEICRYTNRDQMSFPYVWWKMKDRILINLVDGNARTHEYFKYINHLI